MTRVTSKAMKGLRKKNDQNEFVVSCSYFRTELTWPFVFAGSNV